MNMDATNEFIVGEIRDVFNKSSVLKEKFKKDVLSNKGKRSSEIEVEKNALQRTLKTIDKAIDTTDRSTSLNEVNKMLGKTKDKIYKGIKKELDNVKGGLEDRKLNVIEEIKDLDNQKDWIDWITRYGKEIKLKFKNISTDLLEGMIDNIIVSGTFGLNRDEEEKQIGHKIIINFKQGIVGDSIKYEDKNNKSKGYNVIEGKKKLDIGYLAILKGGRGNTLKKKQTV